MRPARASPVGPVGLGPMCFVPATRFWLPRPLWVYGVMLLGYAGYVVLVLPAGTDPGRDASSSSALRRRIRGARSDRSRRGLLMTGAGQAPAVSSKFSDNVHLRNLMALLTGRKALLVYTGRRTV